jgi:predicted Zn-dependent protease with MMP-like domain
MTGPEEPGPKRRAYKRRPPADAISDRPRFASVVQQYMDAALDALPRQYATRLDNVVFVVRREPGPAERASLGLRRGQTLYGLYQGVPVTVRGSGYHLAAPDKITVFWLPLVRDFPDDGRLAEQVKKTVFHEIAHHFGINDHDLRHTSVG